MKFLVVIIMVCVGLALLKKVIYRVKKGSDGEKKVARELKKLGKKYKVYNNIYLPKGTSSYSQCDHIVVSVLGIWVIETKNYSGKIVEKKGSWKVTCGDKSYDLYSPVEQNKEHVRQLIKFLEEKGVQVKKEDIESLIVFVGNADLRGVKSRNVIELSELVERIKSVKKRIYYKKVEDIGKYLRKERGNIAKSIKHIKNIKRNKRMGKKKCPKCGKSLTIRDGKYGKFIGCTGYPKCNYVRKK